MEETMGETINIAFCGAGFLGIYHVGVVSCLKSHARRLLGKISKYGGCSAGALAACMLLCDIDMEECVHFVMNQASKVHKSTLGPLSRKFNIVEQIRKSSAKHLPVDAYQKASGKLYISLTRVADFQNVIVSQYDSNKDLIDALICTCFIPVFCGMIPPTFQGTAYIDGGLSDNLPQHFDGTTITVSPFGGENDICPDDRHKSSSQFDMKNTNIQFSCHNLYRMTRALFPPNNDVLIKMCQEGFSDAFSYLYKTYADYLTYDDSIKFSITHLLDKMAAEQQSNVESEAPSTTGDGVDEDDDWSLLMNDTEQLIATGKAFQMLASPNELNEILSKTKELLEGDHLNWYFVQLLFTLARWTSKPCAYTTTCVLNLSRQMFSSFLPKIKSAGSKSTFTQNLIDLVTKGFHAYKETAIFEWHPTIKEENQIRIQQSKERLKSVAKSLKSVPNRTSATTLKCSTKTPSKEHSLLQGDSIDENVNDDDLEITADYQSGDIIYFSACSGGGGGGQRQQLMSFEEDLMNYDEDPEGEERCNHDDNDIVDGPNRSYMYPSLSRVSTSAETAVVVVSDGVKDLMGRALGYIFLKSLGFR